MFEHDSLLFTSQLALPALFALPTLYFSTSSPLSACSPPPLYCTALQVFARGRPCVCVCVCACVRASMCVCVCMSLCVTMDLCVDLCPYTHMNENRMTSCPYSPMSIMSRWQQVFHDGPTLRFLFCFPRLRKKKCQVKQKDSYKKKKMNREFLTNKNFMENALSQKIFFKCTNGGVAEECWYSTYLSGKIKYGPELGIYDPDSLLEKINPFIVFLLSTMEDKWRFLWS